MDGHILGALSTSLFHRCVVTLPFIVRSIPFVIFFGAMTPEFGRYLYQNSVFCGISIDAVRPQLSILANIALLVGFWEAPFLHIHQHEATQRHPGALLHFHLKTAHFAGTGSEFRSLDPDDDVLLQNWVSASPTGFGLNPAILTEPFFLTAPAHSGWTVAAPPHTGHDPPLILLHNPRAPPA
jgi:hypothetical protein